MYFVCPYICIARSFVCDGVCLFMRLCYGVYLLLAYRFHWFVLCVMLCEFLGFCFAFGVCVVFVVCCVADWCFIGLSCVYVLLLLCCIRCCVLVLV